MKEETQLKLSDFEYDLPNELIARYPTERRQDSRLMVVHRKTGIIEDRRFIDLPEYLRSGDVMVMNNTRVIPARLIGRRIRTGAEVEVFLLRELSREGESVDWEVLARPAKKVLSGEDYSFGESLTASVLEELPDGMRRMRLTPHGTSFELAIEAVGHVPLPPYLGREDEALDRERYQTVFAEVPGAVAAPTAALHFTPELLSKISESGVEIGHVLLHTGLGTFRPVEVDAIRDHKMHAEYFEVSPALRDRVNLAKREKRRVIAVGTTTVRTLESASATSGELESVNGETEIFIYPPYKFKIPDAMLTNFHMPRSTLLMMISAFASRELILHAYRHAVAERYRFFSYGDSMLIL